MFGEKFVRQLVRSPRGESGILTGAELPSKPENEESLLSFKNL